VIAALLTAAVSAAGAAGQRTAARASATVAAAQARLLAEGCVRAALAQAGLGTPTDQLNGYALSLPQGTCSITAIAGNGVNVELQALGISGRAHAVLHAIAVRDLSCGRPQYVIRALYE
jgi:hypothetical protein